MSQPAVKILHIEDRTESMFPVEAILRQEMQTCIYDVVHVETLREGMQAMRQHHYDAVLLDLPVGDRKGLENVQRLREQNPELPVVVLSGWENSDIALEAIDRGAQEYLVKSQSDPRLIQLAIQSSIKRKQIERQLFRQANYDSLTGLANRRQFQVYTERSLHRAQRWGSHKALMFIDLDNFKYVNDTFGHEAGDAVLREAAIRMTHALRKSDMVARFAGDEFVILLDDHKLEHKMVGASVAKKLLKVLNEPVIYGERKLPLRASIGIAVYPGDGRDYKTLLRAADQAMYYAKMAGGNQFYFAHDEEMFV